jgi:hypothetical protein
MHTSRTCRLRLLTVLGVLVAAASIAPAASAAQRYASPTGSGIACTSASPCSITQAVGNAITGDEVIINPGGYPLTQTLSEGGYMGGLAKITIHGVAGQPRPRLQFSGPGQRGVDLEGGSTLRYVEIDQASPDRALFAGGGADVDQVVATAHGDTGIVTAQIRNATIRNSVVVASGANARALATESGSGPPITAAYRNVTAVASGSGAVTIDAYAATQASVTAHLVNVIAYGSSGALPIQSHTDSSNGATATMTVTHSVYASWDVSGAAAKIVDDGGNRWEEPAFVNAAAGDYHQAPGSYTIDAGLDDLANGPFDVDGDPRTIGRTDIGADEFVPAPPATSRPPAPTSTATTPASTPATAPTPGFAGVRLASTRLALARGLITVTLRCPSGTVGRCSGKTRLTARRRATSSRAATTVTLGRAAFSIAAGKQARVRARVSRAGRRLLGRVRRLRGKDTNAARNGAGQSRTTVAAVTIRRRHR